MLPCARVGERGWPEWVRPVAFDEFLQSNNLAAARAGVYAPVPYARWIERTNREDATVQRPERTEAIRGRIEAKGPDSASRGIAPWAAPPRLSDVSPVPLRQFVEKVARAYTQTTMLPRGMTMDVLA